MERESRPGMTSPMMVTRVQEDAGIALRTHATGPSIVLPWNNPLDDARSLLFTHGPLHEARNDGKPFFWTSNNVLHNHSWLVWRVKHRDNASPGAAPVPVLPTLATSLRAATGSSSC